MNFEDFLKDEQVNDVKDNTLSQHRSVLKVIDRWKPLNKKWTKQDINDYVLSLKYKPSTIQKHKQLLKKYFRWCDNDKAVEHLKVKSIGNDLRREDILTVEDVNALIDKTPYPMYKALIAFMFESGARISEILAIKVSDISEDKERGMIVSVPSTKSAGTGNTEYRRDLYPFSAGYIRNHITFNNLKESDLLFNVGHVPIHNMLQRLKKRTGIKKPISCHKFRNARALDLILRGYNELLIKKKLGWGGDSAMLNRYVKLSDEDNINATFNDIPGNGGTKKPRVLTNIKEADKLKSDDMALQVSALQAENQELKAQLIEVLENQNKATKLLTILMERNLKGESIDDLLENED